MRESNAEYRTGSKSALELRCCRRSGSSHRLDCNANEDMKKQHWSGVFIELVIVVVGVFIGLQVNNWNQARADARLGQDYVKRLTRDLQENLTGLRAEIAYYSAVLESVQRTDELLRAADPDPRALVVNAYRAT